MPRKRTPVTATKCRLCDRTIRYGGFGRPRELCVVHRRLVTSEGSRERKRAWRERRKAAASA